MNRDLQRSGHWKFIRPHESQFPVLSLFRSILELPDRLIRLCNQEKKSPVAWWFYRTRNRKMMQLQKGSKMLPQNQGKSYKRGFKYQVKEDRSLILPRSSVTVSKSQKIFCCRVFLAWEDLIDCQGTTEGTSYYICESKSPIVQF